MARKLRIEFPGAVYHITSRGNARQEIFVNDIDRETFLEVLTQVVERFNWLCHAYCLMDNHYHLLVETLAPTLSRGMRQLNGVYTQSFNRRHKQTGHLFQGRFRAILVEKEAYLLELCRYIVLNPVRAKMAQQAGDWPWSSYRATAGAVSSPAFLTTDWLLGQFGGKKREARKHYCRFVAEGAGIEPWQDLRGQLFLGSDEFIENLPKHTELLEEVLRTQQQVIRPRLAEIFRSVSQDTGIAVTYREYGYTMKEIAAHLGVHYATVSRRLRKHELRKSDNR